MDKEMWWALLRIIIVLPLICGLAYLTVRYGLNWTKRMPFQLSGGGKRMRLLEHLSLGPKGGGLSLIQIGSKYVLLAHQEGAMVVVREMDEPPDTIETEQPPDSRLALWINQYGKK